jgi:hypothetical protein
MDSISIYIDVQICMFSYILQLICLSTCFFEYKCNIYKKLYITDASVTLRFRGFLENDASDAPASCNTDPSYQTSLTHPLCIYLVPEISRPVFATLPTLGSNASSLSLSSRILRLAPSYTKLLALHLLSERDHQHTRLV